jgi:formylglycine-generating enzyme required for sulfatase activity
VTSFTSGELGAIESLPPTSESTECTGTHLGTVVLVPSSAGNDATVGFKIVTALDGETASACSGAAAAGNPKCIVERRALNYIPHTPLEVIVDMTAACEGQICDAQSTCVNGVCVNAVIPDPASCEGSGCGEGVLGPVPDDGGYDATVGASSDASTDAPTDAPTDANDSGAATPDSGADAGTDSGSVVATCTPGAQQCSGGSAVQTCGINGIWSAPWPCATNVCTGGACAGFTLGTSSPSCAGGGPGLSDCADGGDSCCTSLEVPGGTYARAYNGAGDGGPNPATVSGFRLDKYLVTVGRYRRFVNAWDGGAGFEPDAGSGKHTHLNGGQGLVALGEDAGPGYESGWLASDDVNVSPPSHLACDPPYDTWTDAGASQENLPINCVNWQEAYAFCIWDGAFLPSEAEWAFAAAGGSQQLLYPWGPTDPGAANQYAIYGSDNASCYYPGPGLQTCTGVSNFAPVGSAPMGAGVWGQLDLGGEVFEWVLDSFWFFPNPCVDCAFMNLSVNDYRSVRGGAFNVSGNYLSGAQRFYGTPQNPAGPTGFRCARAP